MFIHGRTETIRSCSMESVAFAKAMCSPPNTVSDQEKVQLLKEAVKAHKDYTVMAMSGEGVDRHLLGLKLIARENNVPVPELYSDEAFIRSTHFRISTSQVASAAKAFMCYGPAVDDGYGICYNPRNDDIFLAVSAFNSCPSTSAKAMGDCLIQALETMYKVLSKAGERRLSKLWYVKMVNKFSGIISRKCMRIISNRCVCLGLVQSLANMSNKYKNHYFLNFVSPFWFISFQVQFIAFFQWEMVVVSVFLVEFQCRLSPWSTVQGSVNSIELSLHSFDPIAASISGNFTNPSSQFCLSLLRFMQFIVADSVVAVERVLWTNVQRGQDGCIETKC